MKGIQQYVIDEAINVSRTRLIQYAEVLKKRIKAKRYEVEDVIVDGTAGQMAISFNTGLSLLLSEDNMSIVGFKTDVNDKEYYQLPNYITGFKTLEKHIKLLKLNAKPKADPQPKEIVVPPKAKPVKKKDIVSKKAKSVGIPSKYALKVGEEIVDATPRQMAGIVKSILKEKFGITKARVKTDYSSLNIYYDLGAKSSEVEKYFNNLQYGSFDGMQDMYIMNDKTEGIVYGKYRLPTYKYVMINRNIPSEFLTKMSLAFSKSVDYAEIPRVTKESETTDTFPSHFMGYWTWNQFMAGEYARYMSFPSQESKDMDIEVVEYNKSSNLYDFVIKSKGKKYMLSADKYN